MSRVVMTESGRFNGGAGTTAITSQSGGFASVVRESAGQYLVTMEDDAGIGEADTVRATKEDIDSNNLLSVAGAVERVSALQFRARFSGGAGVAGDQNFQVTIATVQVG